MMRKPGTPLLILPSQRAWDMGEIMGQAFLHTVANADLEKVALEAVDQRIAGEVNESVQGDAPMKAQALEDKKDRENPMASAVQNMLHARMGMGASASGEVQPGADTSSFQSPPGPQDGDVSQSGYNQMEKKVAHAADEEDSAEKTAARELLRQYLQSR